MTGTAVPVTLEPGVGTTPRFRSAWPGQRGFAAVIETSVCAPDSTSIVVALLTRRWRKAQSRRSLRLKMTAVFQAVASEASRLPDLSVNIGALFAMSRLLRAVFKPRRCFHRERQWPDPDVTREPVHTVYSGWGNLRIVIWKIAPDQFGDQIGLAGGKSFRTDDCGEADVLFESAA